MADDLKNTGPADDNRVNVNQDHEVRYWTRKFGCTEQELRQAVSQAGVSANAVRLWIEGAKQRNR